MDSRGDRKDLNNEAFSHSNSITTPSKKTLDGQHKAYQILNFIRNNPGTNSYEIAKQNKWSYSDVLRKVRDLIYCNLIWSRKILKNGREIKKLYSIGDFGSAEADEFFEEVLEVRDGY